MHIWTTKGKRKFDLVLLRAHMEIQSNKDIRIIADASISLAGQITPQGEIIAQLDHSELAELARIYRDQVQSAVDDLARVINAGAGDRQIRQQVEWIESFWSVTDEELDEYLLRTRTPMERIKKIIAVKEQRSTQQILNFRIG